MDKFLGLGLVNLVGVAVFVMLFIVLTKVVTMKFPVPGVSEVVNMV